MMLTLERGQHNPKQIKGRWGLKFMWKDTLDITPLTLGEIERVYGVDLYSTCCRYFLVSKQGNLHCGQCNERLFFNSVSLTR